MKQVIQNNKTGELKLEEVQYLLRKQVAYWFVGKAESVYAIADNYNHPEIEIEDIGIVTQKIFRLYINIKMKF